VEEKMMMRMMHVEAPRELGFETCAFLWKCVCAVFFVCLFFFTSCSYVCVCMLCLSVCLLRLLQQQHILTGMD